MQRTLGLVPGQGSEELQRLSGGLARKEQSGRMWWRHFREDRAMTSRHMRHSRLSLRCKAERGCLQRKQRRKWQISRVSMRRLGKQREAWIWSRARRKVSAALYRGTTSAEGLRMKVRVPELRGQRGGPFLKMSFGAQMRSSKRKKDLIARWYAEKRDGLSSVLLIQIPFIPKDQGEVLLL